MNSQDHDQPASDLPAGAAPAIEAPKLRRKRNPRVADVSALADAPVAVAVVAPSAEEVFKPKRSRRKGADDVTAAAVAPASTEPCSVATLPIDSDTAGLLAEPVKPGKPRRRAVPAAEAVVLASDLEPDAPAAGSRAGAVPMPTAEPVPAQAAGALSTVESAEDALAEDAPAADAPAEDAPAEDAPEADAAAAAAAPPQAGPADDESGEGEGARRRNRNRRRGRRSGADRAPSEDGSPAGVSGPETVSASAGDDDDDERSERAAVEMPRAAPLDAGETFAAVLSGEHDAEPAADASAAPTEPERRVLAAEPDAPKLHKVLAQAGIGSRRDMEELIAEGQVMVNGQPAHTGQRISFGDRISVAGKLVKVRIAPPPPRIIAYHKPVGEIVTNDDPQHRPTVYRRLPRLHQGKWQSVGRLDINTEGLLLFTNSGELANQLMHPRFGVEREYAVRVLGTLEPEARHRLIDGVEIDGQRAGFKSIEDGGGEGVNHWYRVVITEGRNREVRKLFDKVGLGVSRLIRIRYGCVVLPRGLRRGLFVDLNEAEVREVRRLAGAGRDQPVSGPAAGLRPPRQEVQGNPAGQAPRDGQGPGRGNTNRRNGPPPARAERDKADRPARPDRQAERAVDRPGERAPARNAERRERPPRLDGDAEHENFAAIPNPLMQTFDKRAIREARAPRREIAEDGPIPNPLEQTYDKRFVQKPQGFGGGGGRKGGGGGAGGQPDPMKTSLGYIGADAFVRKFQGNGGAGGGGGGGGGGGNRRGGR